MGKPIVATIACMVIGHSAAMASEAKPGVYIGLGAGSNIKLDTDVAGPGADSTVEYDLGYGAMGSVGYAFRGGPRVELELSHRDNAADSVTRRGALPAGTSLDTATTTGMLNVLYDFHNSYGVIPTVGVGIGWAFATAEDLGDDFVFAYQGIAGLGYELTDRVTAFAEYRFLGTQEIEGSTGGNTFKLDNFNHTALFGVRFRLGDPFGKPDLSASDQYPRSSLFQARDRAARAGALTDDGGNYATPSSYLVFFEFDQAELSSAAAAIVRAAAASVRSGQNARLEVTGHADRSGSAGYNERLSAGRAEAVRRLLEDEGVEPGAIVVMSKGEAEPLISTSDGSREPQNRRVEIVVN